MSELTSRYNPLYGLEMDFHRNVINLFCLPVPKLELVCFIRLGISLWKNALHSLEFCRLNESIWETASNLVMVNLKKLVDINLLPKKLLPEAEKRAKEVGKEIKEFLDLFIVNLGNAKVYIKYLQWNSQGTINRIETVSLIIRDEHIEKLEKYALACKCCPEEVIRDLKPPELPESFLENLNLNNDILVVFWTLYIEEDYKKLYHLFYKDDILSDIQQYKNKAAEIFYGIFIQALKIKNEIAVQCIWNNFLEEVKNKIFMCTPREMSKTSPRILLFFLSEVYILSYPSIADSLLELLKYIGNDWRLKDRFIPIAKYAILIINQKTETGTTYCRDTNYSDFISIIVLCWERKIIDDSETIAMIRNTLIICRYSSKITFDMELYTNLEIIFVSLAINGKFDLLYPTIINIKQLDFSNIFFRSKGIEIFLVLLNGKKFDDLNMFFSILSETVCFKELQLVEQERLTSRLKMISGYQDELVDGFLSWHMEGNEDKIANYKADLYFGTIITTEI